MTEQWRAVPLFEGIYEVSSFGRVRSLDRTVQRVRNGKTVLVPWPGRELALITEANGYVRVRLRVGGGKVLLHRLVLTAFNGPAPDGHEGAHNDGNKANCRLDNLRWATRSDNLSDKVGHGTSNHGERSPNARLTAAEVAEIRASSDTQTSLAARFGVSQARISKIIRREAWV
jgi:hypothetical protein